jgi:hypothetical protein
MNDRTPLTVAVSTDDDNTYPYRRDIARGEGNPVVFQAPDGRVWLFYVNRYGESWSNARVKGKISNDVAQTWSDSFMLNFEEGTMVRGRPIVLNNGDYLLPMYYETGDDREMTASTTCSYFMRYKPKTKVKIPACKIINYYCKGTYPRTNGNFQSRAL